MSPSPTSADSRRYLWYLGLTGFGLLASLVTLTYWVDPYFIHQWGTPVLERLSPPQQKIVPWGKTYAAYRYQREIESKKRVLVGVNEYVSDERPDIPLLTDVARGQQVHLDRLNRVRRERDNRDVARRLSELRQAARGDANLMPYVLEAVRAYATLGEMCGVLREVFGEHAELIIT